jgi:UDP-N-acetyl-D-glucosamine dehydrogenase
LLGAIDEESQVRALSFYESICDEVVAVSTPEVAEAAKLLENTFRLVNIALVNEFTQLCSTSGINVHEVIDAASSKPYGYMPFRSGVGVGGHCIPVDPLYLTWWARQNGGRAHLVESADLINHEMPKYVAERALQLVSSDVRNPRVLILGVAYKSGVGDIRETPVSELCDHLKSLGGEVAWHDPLVQNWEGSQQVEIGWECDVAILATMQPGMDLDQLIARNVPILDCTNTLRNQLRATSL